MSKSQDMCNFYKSVNSFATQKSIKIVYKILYIQPYLLNRSSEWPAFYIRYRLKTDNTLCKVLSQSRHVCNFYPHMNSFSVQKIDKVDPQKLFYTPIFFELLKLMFWSSGNLETHNQCQSVQSFSTIASCMQLLPACEFVSSAKNRQIWHSKTFLPSHIFWTIKANVVIFWYFSDP